MRNFAHTWSNPFSVLLFFLAHHIYRQTIIMLICLFRVFRLTFLFGCRCCRCLRIRQGLDPQEFRQGRVTEERLQDPSGGGRGQRIGEGQRFLGEAQHGDHGATEQSPQRQGLERSEGHVTDFAQTRQQKRGITCCGMLHACCRFAAGCVCCMLHGCDMLYHAVYG